MKSEIVFEDADLLVCYKPAGLPTQTAQISGVDCVSEITNYLAKTQKQNSPYLALINRLDQPVEGLVLFAKKQMAAKQLNEWIVSDKIQKYYFAVVEGIPKEEKAELVNYLIKDKNTNLSKVVPSGMPGAKRAELFYEICKSDENALLRIRLKTGRHHQIRVQMAYAGYPLLGDQKYGAQKNQKGIGLCAYRLCIPHPTTKEEMEFKISPKGENFSLYL